MELRGVSIDKFRHVPGKPGSALTSFRPVPAEVDLDAVFLAVAPDDSEFRLGIGGEVIDRHRNRHTEMPEVAKVLAEVLATFTNSLRVFAPKVLLRYAAVHLQRSYRCDQHHRRWLQVCLPAFDVEKLLGAEVGAETGFRHDIVCKLD